MLNVDAVWAVLYVVVCWSDNTKKKCVKTSKASKDCLHIL